MSHRNVNFIQIISGQISLLLGLSGNFFVLYASIFHHVIKLDKMSVWIIQNLSVADIGNCIFVLIPNLITMYSDRRWVFGRWFCYVNASYRFSFFVTNLILVNLLSLNKLLRCCRPLRNLHPSRRQRFLVTLLVFITFTVPILWICYGFVGGFMWISITEYPDEIETSYNCISYTDKDAAGPFRYQLNMILITIFNLLPCVSLVISNSLLICYAAKKSHTHVKKRSLLVVILVTTSLLLSFGPMYAAIIFRSATSSAFEELSWSLAFWSSWSNPVVYLAVNPSFRQFTIRQVKSLLHPNKWTLGQDFTSRVPASKTFVSNKVDFMCKDEVIIINGTLLETTQIPRSFRASSTC